MAQRRGFSGTFNSPSPVDHSDAMILNFAMNGPIPDGEVIPPQGFSDSSNTSPGTIADNNVIIFNRAGTLSLLRITGPANATTVTESWTVQVNGMSTTIVATTVIGSPNALDNTHSVNVVAGDICCILHNIVGGENFAQFAGALYFTPA